MLVSISRQVKSQIFKLIFQLFSVTKMILVSLVLINNITHCSVYLVDVIILIYMCVCDDFLSTYLCLLFCSLFRRVRWSVYRSLTCSKSSSPRRHGCSSRFCVELHMVQCLRIRPVLLNKVSQTFWLLLWCFLHAASIFCSYLITCAFQV